MRKIYSLVLMAAALLVGTNVQASITSEQDLRTAIDNASTTKGSPTTIELGTSLFLQNGTLEIKDGQQIILNLGGYTLSSNKSDQNVLTLKHGYLKVQNGTVQATYNPASSAGKAIEVFGSSVSSDSKYSVLEIAENASVLGDEYCVVVTENSGGYAYGVEVIIDGYVRGGKYGVKVNGAVKGVAEGNIAKVTISESAEIESSDGLFGGKTSVAVYCSGTAKWEIKGYVHGAVGVAVKAGEVTIKDAIIEGTGEANTEVTPGGSGINGGAGSGILVSSQEGYQGNINLNITGDTKVTAEAGYALSEVIVKTEKETSVASIKIDGGTFEGGDAGSIAFTNETVTSGEKTVVLAGGNIIPSEDNSAVTVGGSSAAEDIDVIMSGHYTTIQSGNKNIFVFSEGATPTPSTTLAEATGESVVLAANDLPETLTVNKELKSLEMTNATSVIIPANVTLKITEKLIMGDDAQIEIKAGGKLLIEGRQGIVAPSTDNIVVKADASGMGMFLLAPTVQSNRKPNATVEYYAAHASSVNTNTADNKFDIFVSPFIKIDEISSNIDAGKNLPDYGTTMGTWYQAWMGTKWEQHDRTWIQQNVEAFQAIAITNTANINDASARVTYTFKGQLQGNISGIFNLGKGFMYLGNAFLAPMDATKILDQLSIDNVEHSVWVWTKNQFNAIIKDNIGTDMPEMKPMDIFIIKTNTSGAKIDLNYKDLIWEFNNK